MSALLPKADMRTVNPTIGGIETSLRFSVSKKRE